MPDSGQSHALEAGLGAGVSALGKVAEIWRDRENFQAQSEQMAQALDREGMTQEASMYRSAAQSATTNFFTDPATNRKAQQGLLSDALKLLSNKQENDLKRELLKTEIAGRVSLYRTRDAAEEERKRREYEAARPIYNASNPVGAADLPPVEEGGAVPDISLLPPLARPVNPNEARRIDIEERELDIRERAQDEKEKVRRAAESKAAELDAEIDAARKQGLTVTPYTRGGLTSGYVAKNLNGQEVTRKGTRVIREAADGSFEIEDLETRTTVPTRPETSSGTISRPIIV